MLRNMEDFQLFHPFEESNFVSNSCFLMFYNKVGFGVPILFHIVFFYLNFAESPVIKQQLSDCTPSLIIEFRSEITECPRDGMSQQLRVK